LAVIKYNYVKVHRHISNLLRRPLVEGPWEAWG
jgi:hypothetical protein